MHTAAPPGPDADRHAAATALRERAAPIRDAWSALVIEHARLSNGLPGPLLDAYIGHIATFIVHPDYRLPAEIANVWQRSCAPDPETVAATAVAVGLLGEALRVTLDEDLPAVCELACAALPDFSAEFVRSLMSGGDLSPDQRDWYAVMRRLAVERERRVTHLAILNDVSAALSATLSLEELFAIIREQCGRLIPNDTFYIATRGPRPGTVRLGLFYVDGVRQVEHEGEVIEMGLGQVVLDSVRPLVVEDYVAACRERGIAPQPPNTAKRGHIAWLGAPLVARDEAIGILAVASTTGPFERDDIEVLTAIARQAGAAVANAQLFEAARNQAAHLKAINKLQRAIATMRDPEPLLWQACRLIHELFGYSVVALFSAEEGERVVLRAHAGLEHAPHVIGLTLRAGERGIVAHAAATREAFLANDVSREPRYVGAPETAATRAEIAVPLLRDGVLLGVLDIEAPSVDAFDERDVDIITTLADQLAVALENAELFRQERQRRSEMGIILGASQAASASLVLDDVLQHVAEGIADSVGLPGCVIYLYDDEGQRLLPAAFVAREGSRIDTARVSSYIPTAAASGRLMAALGEAPDAIEIRQRPEGVDEEWASIVNPTTALVVPFNVKQRTLGIAVVPAHEPGYRFVPAQRSVACGVASAAALALENARLYARSHTLGMAEERIRVAREIHDGIAQGLTAITLQLEAADQLFVKKPDKARAKIGRALDLARANMDDARRSVLDLRASALQELTLAEAMQRRMQQFNEQHRERGLAGACVCQDLGGRLSARVELSLYRVYEEALDNVARHSGATHVEASLTRVGDWVTLAVRDNGHGFDIERAFAGDAPLSGFGLVAIRERMRLLHGSLVIEPVSEPQPGTLLRATAPFESHIGDPDAPRTASIGYSSAHARGIEQNGQGEP